MKAAIIIISIVTIAIERLYKPRLDHTRDGKLLLWYGVKIRKYIEIKL